MNFLIDQQLPRKLAVWIRAQGHHAFHIRDLGLEHAEDRDIWREAETRSATIITKDDDFSGIARTVSGVQVIWLRLGNCSNERLLTRLADLWPALVAELQAGAPLVEVR